MTAMTKHTKSPESRASIAENLKIAQAFLAKVQAEIEQFGLINDDTDKSDWYAVIKKLEKEIPRGIYPQIRTRIKRGLANIAMQQDPQSAWQILEDVYHSAEATIRNLEETDFN